MDCRLDMAAVVLDQDVTVTNLVRYTARLNALAELKCEKMEITMKSGKTRKNKVCVSRKRVSKVTVRHAEAKTSAFSELQ